ncbi:MAG: PDDEXK nuclease domain-containing protein [Rhodocyclaceae bacterium]|nr:PDDEXK nuclease domain-containing protein [Rhodocyclaceae bacterium]MDZ4215177.1 PDDEXK nuclease domain-containing protein [Rhodocyclaceae bacterium]
MATKKPVAVATTPPLFGRVREILEAARSNIARTVNTTQVIANWLIGREIVEEEQRGKKRADYGQQLVLQLSAELTTAYGKGWSAQNLFYMKQFYLAYPGLLPEDGIVHAAGGQSSLTSIVHAVRGQSSAIAQTATACLPGCLHPHLSWTHYRTLLRVSRSEARNFYEIETVRNAWTARELERQINSLLFDRLAKSRDKAGLLRLASHGQEVAQPIDVLKDPVVLEFLDLPESPRLVESKLEQALIGNLQTFLMELGKGFAFVSRQERITLDGDHFYIDLVFYHTVLKCFVLIDLKVGKLTHADLGQIQFYVNYYDRERRTEGDNPTIGLILCPDKNDAVVKYTLGEQQERNIFTSRYQLYLPTVEELEDELRRELRFLTPTEGKATAPRSKKPTSKKKGAGA